MAETRSYQPPVRHNASAFRRLVDHVELRKTGTGEYSSVLTNEDLLPVPYEKRTWTKWTCRSLLTSRDVDTGLIKIQTRFSGSVNVRV